MRESIYGSSKGTLGTFSQALPQFKLNEHALNILEAAGGHV